MMRSPGLGALLLIIPLCGAVCGCAMVHTWEKCGFGGCVGDREITAEVQALFTQHGALEVPNVLHIQTLNRVVYLSGIVNSPREQQLATLVARQAPGVADVVNSIGLYNGR